jgi:hypothetical protein
MDELSETCRVSCQNEFVKLVHLVGFVIKKKMILRVTYRTLIQMPQHLYKILHKVGKSNEGIQKIPLIFIGQKMKVQNTKIWCEFFQTGFHSYDRWQYSGSLLWDLRATSLMIMVGWGGWTITYLYHWLEITNIIFCQGEN